MALSQYQKELQKLGPNATAEQKRALNLKFFGDIDRSQIPGDAQIIEDVPGELVRYKDKDGFVHTLQRQFDATKADLGKVNETTNRPGVVTPPEATNLQNQLLTSLAGRLQNPYDLDPGLNQAVQDINSAEQTQLDQQFSEGADRLVASLYGRGINKSSLANDASARFLQDQGLVRAQALANEGSRLLQARGIGQQQQSLDQTLALSLLGQGSQNQATSGQLSLQKQQLDQAMQQFLETLKLERDKYEQSQKTSLFDQITKGLGAAISIAGAPFTGGASLAGLGGLFKGSSTGGIVDSPMSGGGGGIFDTGSIFA
jgi:hypothetical protein